MKLKNITYSLSLVFLLASAVPLPAFSQSLSQLASLWSIMQGKDTQYQNMISKLKSYIQTLTDKYNSASDSEKPGIMSLINQQKTKLTNLETKYNNFLAKKNALSEKYNNAKQGTSNIENKLKNDFNQSHSSINNQEANSSSSEQQAESNLKSEEQKADQSATNAKNKLKSLMSDF